MKKTRLHPVITGILKKRGYETREEIEEFLSPGTYRVDIFADGNLIGRKSFILEK